MKENPIAISLDFKKNRIRIHKKTLKRLDNPHHIIMYVDLSNAAIAIKRCSDFIKDAIKLEYDSDADCEVYSDRLMSVLAEQIIGCDRKCTYRVIGEMYGPDAARFDLSNAEPWNIGKEV